MTTTTTLGLIAVAALAASGTATAQSAAHSAAPATMLVLDASGSMWGQIDGQAKIGIARGAVATMLSEWDGGDLGLMAYGHRRKGDCNDIEVLLPAGPGQADAIRERVDALQPRGMTPITAAVREAAAQLRHVEQKATVILVSDGEETCDADPCALGRELEAAGVDFTAHVIGFDIEHGSDAQRQLQCLADATGGRYLQARNAAELGQALERVAAPVDTPPVPTLRAREGDAWIEGMALEAEVSVTLDPDAGEGPGNHHFEVGQTAADCRALCDADDACAGWHYEPTGSYFVDHPRCHLKGHGFAVRLLPQGEGWAAGIKPGVKLILIEDAE